MQFNCTICNKPYKSYQSLWNHNKKFHPKVENDDNNKPNIETHVIKCTYCNAVFTTRQAKSLHIKKYCKRKLEVEKEENKKTEKEKQNEDKLNDAEEPSGFEASGVFGGRGKASEAKLKIQILREQRKLKEEEAKVLKLKLKLENAKKQDNNQTPEKINRLLENYYTKQSNIAENKHLFKDIHEFDINEEFTDSVMQQIAKEKFNSIETLIEKIYCGDLNQHKNIIITNAKSTNLHMYDTKLRQYIMKSKKQVLNKLIEHRSIDLDIILDKIGDKLDNQTLKSIKNFIHELNYSKTKYEANDGIVHANRRQYLIHSIGELLYNNKNKMMRSIANYIGEQEKQLDEIIEKCTIDVNTLQEVSV